MAQPDKSLLSIVLRSRSKAASVGLEIKIFFSLSNADCSLEPQQNSTSPVSLVSGVASCEKFLMNLWQKFANPRNDQTPFTVLGASYSRIAATLSRSILIPLPALIINPRYLVNLVLNSHFLILTYSPTSCSFLSTFQTCSLCYFRLLSV